MPPKLRPVELEALLERERPREVEEATFAASSRSFTADSWASKLWSGNGC